MDWASVAGLVLGLAGLLLGHGLEGGKFASLVQPAAFAIVVIGTAGAVLLQTDAPTFMRGVRMLRWVFRPPPSQRQRLARDIASWSLHARRDGLLSLEKFMLGNKDKFIQKGLRLVVDGIAPEKLRGLLETEVTAYEFGQRQAARIWESAAGYSPTIGILGAVLGLIHVMENLGDPGRLGNGIAVAFVSTVYGVGLANLFYYPVGNKIKNIVAETVTQYEILTEVFHDIASGDHTRVVEERVASLLARLIMARKKFDGEIENHERWLISYADFITLLFAFFVVMYAISVVNEGKYKVFAMSVDNAFSGKDTVVVMVPGQTPTVQPLPSPLSRKRDYAMRKEREAMKKLAQDLSATLAPLVKEGKVRVTQNSLGVSVEINASVLFDPGEARLARESEQALRALGTLLKDDTHAIQVEGHTDDTRIANAMFPSNWELSSVRASSVVRLFVDSGVAEARLTAVGRASNVPVSSNDTPEGKARNRRVAVTILSALPDTTTEIPTQ